MKVLIAPNSMKGSLSAFEFADVVEKAFADSQGNFEIRKLPVADGGDFTGEVLQRALGADFVDHEVTGPLGGKVPAGFWKKENTAIIEMANASGMKLVSADLLNPMEASSFGTGELIKAAIGSGCDKILLAIGGSATVDGGMGMMEALGFGFFDRNGNPLTGNGKNLEKIETIRKVKFDSETDIKIICDVDNPLLGENGAAAVFGPQKGATPEMVKLLEKGLENWSELILRETGKNMKNVKGAGAAGGIAVPLVAFFNAEIVEGAQFVLEVTGFEQHVKWADLVITGEGKLDSQTLNNKAPYAVARAARKFNKPVYAFAGIAEGNFPEVFERVITLVDETVSVADAMKNAPTILYRRALDFATSML